MQDDRYRAALEPREERGQESDDTGERYEQCWTTMQITIKRTAMCGKERQSLCVVAPSLNPVLRCDAHSSRVSWTLETDMIGGSCWRALIACWCCCFNCMPATVTLQYLPFQQT